MTADEAAAIAARAAHRLNVPWDERTAVAKRLLPWWPFPGSWRVVSRVPEEFAETTMIVAERTGQAFPRRVRYSRTL
jgi:hypothetical protein